MKKRIILLSLLFTAPYLHAMTLKQVEKKLRQNDAKYQKLVKQINAIKAKHQKLVQQAHTIKTEIQNLKKQKMQLSVKRVVTPGKPVQPAPPKRIIRPIEDIEKKARQLDPHFFTAPAKPKPTTRKGIIRPIKDIEEKYEKLDIRVFQ